MAIYHLVMTIRVGIYPKKKFKKFDHVQLLWNDPYKLSDFLIHLTQKGNKDNFDANHFV